ncbi:hypothetical protein M7I_0115 [Glarea lozoyensis 74030]|uniref:Uncharacterized protein n=1 Tax=Glarea lozoyensis (strain ATCC 74030 / MF5533) TaxID=1104152 RepID=H0ECH7_GLAL7|nr:hypothetical protein M7I_0115 [Glarea lozoyensis 74030]
MTNKDTFNNSFDHITQIERADEFLHVVHGIKQDFSTSCHEVSSMVSSVASIPWRGVLSSWLIDEMKSALDLSAPDR